MNVLPILLIFFIRLCISGSSAFHKLSFDRENGEFFSTGFPDKYDNNMAESIRIIAREREIIQLTFIYFQLEDSINGLLTDYIRLQEGRPDHNMNPIYLFGHLSVPFIYISTTNQVRIDMITNNQVTKKGVRAQYKILSAHAVCNASNLQSNRSIIRSCTSIRNTRTSKCEVHCRKSYRLQSTRIAACVDGVFTKVTCQLVEETVSKCKKNEMWNCPYSMDDIFNFLPHSRLKHDFNIPISLDEQNRVKVKSGSRFCSTYCHRRRRPPKTYLYPPRCGILPEKRSRSTCVICRYYSEYCHTRQFL